MKRFGIVGGGIHFGIISITQPFFALYASELGASTALIGIMITLRAFLPLFIAMPAGGLIDRLGAPRMLQIGNGITVLSLALMVWSPTLAILAISQLLIGAGTLLMASSLQVIVSEGDKAERELNIVKYSAWSSAGSMLGPLVGGGLIALFAAVQPFGGSGSAELGYRITFIFSLLLAVAFLLSIAWYTRKRPRGTMSAREVMQLLGPREMMGSYWSGAQLLKRPGVQFGLAGTFLIHYLQTIWMSFFPLYLDSIGYGALAISVLVSIRGLAGLLSRSFLPQLTKRFTYESILIGAGCVAALSVIGLPALHWHIVLIGAISFILGFAVGINMPVSTIIMVNDTLKDERGKAMGLRLLTNRASQIAAPAMFGVVGQTLGLTLAFYAGGGVLLVTIAAFGLHYKIRRAGTGELVPHHEKLAPAARDEKMTSGG